MNYLLVVAHPDDEVLGAGATIAKLVTEGHNVDVCVMCSNAQARNMRPSDSELNDDMHNCLSVLGVNKIFKGDFPNIKMNNSDHLELVKFIESAIVVCQPDVIITHHACDTNNDHLHTSLACQAAFRIFQRKSDFKPISELWYMETLSSTDWAVNTAMNTFNPNLFVEIGRGGVQKKIAALSLYRDVMRPYPHPRSEESILGLAAYRGSQSGCCYAEAFECAFRRM